MSPQICTPPLMRRPVQTMISVRVGRSCRTSFRDAIVRFALRRPFAGAASPGEGGPRFGSGVPQGGDWTSAAVTGSVAAWSCIRRRLGRVEACRTG